MGDGVPSQVLKEARGLVKARNYAAALEKYIWFHDHALEHEPGMAGVRLSYAIDEWVELGEVYTPARAALESIRDAKTRMLMADSADFRLFADVRAINRAIGEEKWTCEILASIARRDREFAEKCFPAALDSLVACKEFVLARSLMISPDEILKRFAAPLNSQLALPDRKREAFGIELSFHETLMKIYAKNIGQILQILVGVGEEEEASRVHKAAINLFEDEGIRDRVTEFLSPGSSSKLVN